MLFHCWFFLISKGACLWVMFITKLCVCVHACKCAWIYVSAEWGGGR